MNKNEIITIMNNLHDEMHELEDSVNGMDCVLTMRITQERIRKIRVILDQMNKRIELEITNIRTH